MKLAEALILRSNYQKRIEQLTQRILRNAKVQEGDEPAEPPLLLIEELEQVSQGLVELIQGINRTNSSSFLADDLTIADAIAVRDVLRIRHSVYSNLAKTATVTQERHTKSEVKFKSTVSVSEMQKRADELAKEYRELDARLQEANWKIDLKEK